MTDTTQNTEPTQTSAQIVTDKIVDEKTNTKTPTKGVKSPATAPN